MTTPPHAHAHGHNEHTTAAIASATSFRSPSASQSSSPIEGSTRPGLSRRQSWNSRDHDSAGLGASDAAGGVLVPGASAGTTPSPHGGYAMPMPQPHRSNSGPVQSLAASMASSTASLGIGPNPNARWSGAGASPYPEDGYDLGVLRSTSTHPLQAPRRPYSNAQGSQSRPSLDSRDSATSLPSEYDTGDDRERLTTSVINSSHRSPNRRTGYDADGNIVRGGTLGMIARSPTVRRVSSTLRKASVRVVNIMGTEKDPHEGMVRLPTRDEDEPSSSLERSSGAVTRVSSHDMERMSSGEGGYVGGPPLEPPPPPHLYAPRQAPEGLRGRTLCIFSATNPIRVAMDRLLRFSWTEPAILVLIVVNVIMLALQAAPPLFEPRTEGTFFRDWEDYVLFGLFIAFTVEMFARIIVTGLILDPETSIPAALSRWWKAGQRRAKQTAADAGTSTTVVEPWQIKPTNSDNKSRRPNMLSEVPFQESVARQKGVLSEGRPYLRHSWHRIDMVAVVAFWINFIIAMKGKDVTDTRHLFIFRALSVLRATRLLVITSGTATILHSLKRAGPLILNVSWFLIFAAALFSIVGVQSFRGSLRRFCILTDPYNPDDEITLGSCGGYIDPVTLEAKPYLLPGGSWAQSSPKGYICPLNQVCRTENQSLQDGSVSFDSIFLSLVQVGIIAGVNTWTSTMYATMDSDYFSSTFFFIVAIVVLNFWLMNLLVAVVVNTFQDIRSETKRSAFGADQAVLADPNWAAGTKKPKEVSWLFKWHKKMEPIWVVLIAVDLIAQAWKTARSSAHTLEVLRRMEIAFAIIWLVEITIRMIAYAPDWRGFLSRGRNDFDLVLALGCAIIQIPAIRNDPVYQWLTVFQLLRWYRVILLFPRMRPLLANIFGSFAGMLNMVFFLFLMNFLSALMAVQLLRGDMADEGEMINFSQAWNAFLGMYQMFSTENWTEVLYGAMLAERPFGQTWIVCIFLFVWFMFANFILMQMFIAVINENFEIAEEQKRKQQIEAFIRKSAPTSAHVSWIDRLNPYRLVKARNKTVKVETLPQNLILPLKQTIGADVGTPEPDETNSKTKAALLKRLFGDEYEDKAIPLRDLGKRKERRHSLHPSTAVTDEFEDDRGLTDLLPPLNAGPSVDEHKDALREQRNQQADFIAAHPSYDRSLWFISQRNPVRRFCQALVPPAYGDRIYGRPAHPIWSVAFRLFVFFAVVASIVIAAIATPHYRKEYYARNGRIRGSWFDLCESGLGAVFVIEALVKIIADGFIFSPNAYLYNLWNVVDFVILITIIVNTITELVVIGGVNRATRMIKGFRALRLITLFSRLRDTFHIVFFAGFVRLVDASILMILYIIPFAVWGLNIFSRRLAGCNDDGDDINGKGDCVGEFMNSPVGDLEFLAPRVWANPQFGGSIWAFDSFRESVLILVEIVSLEGWTDVMASAMNIVGIDQQPRTNASQWNSIFFLIFNLFGGVIILTVFLSIIILNFSTRSGSALLTSEQKNWLDLSKFIRQQTPSQLPRQKPRTAIRRWCYDRATHKRGLWAQTYTGLYFLHIALLMTEDYSNTIMNERQLDYTFLVLTILYAIDIVVRFLGLGFKSFRRNGWNLFDVIVVAGSFITTIPALQASPADVGAANNASRQVQKLFLVSVALKLVQRLDSLNQLFKTSVASLPAIGNLFLLWAVLFLFAAIVYMEAFGLTKMGNSAESRYQNYYSFGNAIVMLAFMSTGEGWNAYMHDYTVEYPRCTRGSDYLTSDCGSVAWAYVLFISWNILSMYIFLNMFTGVVVQSFAYVYQMPGSASLDREQIRSFKQVWAEIDQERTGYIRRKDFARFFSKLTGVFEVRLYPVEFSMPHILRAAAPESVSAAMSNKPYIVRGHSSTIDTRRLSYQISRIDFAEVRRRRRQYVKLFNEARISEEPGRGISFTSMLMLLSHYKLIDDEAALQVGDLLARRTKMERVEDMVNLDRVRGLLRTIYWRRQFLKLRNEKQRILAEQDGVPTIVLEPTPVTPPEDDQSLSAYMPDSARRASHASHASRSSTTSAYSRHSGVNPFVIATPDDIDSPITPTGHTPLTPTPGPHTPHTPSPLAAQRGSSSPRAPQSPIIPRIPSPHSPRVSYARTGRTPPPSPPQPQRKGTGGSENSSTSSHGTYVHGLTGGVHARQASHTSQLSFDARSVFSTLSSDDAQRRESSLFEEPEADEVMNALATSVWGDMMRDAVDEEDN